MGGVPVGEVCGVISECRRNQSGQGGATLASASPSWLSAVLEPSTHIHLRLAVPAYSMAGADKPVSHSILKHDSWAPLCQSSRPVCQSASLPVQNLVVEGMPDIALQLGLLPCTYSTATVQSSLAD